VYINNILFQLISELNGNTVGGNKFGSSSHNNQCCDS